MRHRGTTGCAAITASAAAGPIYVFFRCTFEICRPSFQMPHMPLKEALSLVLALPTIIAVGFILSIAFNLIGSLLMADAARESAAARRPVAWMGVGAVAGAFIAFPFSGEENGIDPVVILSLAATAAVCAGLCWRFMGWTNAPDLHEGE